MFIRQVKKKNSSTGKTFYQYQLVQASRILGKVKQHNILYLGSEPALSLADTRNKVLELLQAKIFGQSLLFSSHYPVEVVALSEAFYQKFLLKYKDIPLDSTLSIPPVESQAQMEKIDLNSIEIEDSRTFGGEHLCSQLLELLDLKACFRTLHFSDKEIKTALISIVSRALFSASEFKTTQYLRDNSGLCELHGITPEEVSHRGLYAIADKLYAHKNVIDPFIYNRIVDLFDIKDSLVIYDLSNTYFEGRKTTSKIARYGRSKEKRNDCKQVVFTGVINEQGFIRYSRVYDGNTADIVTLKDMIEDLKKNSREMSSKTVVMDAGFASEDNLEYLSTQGLRYVCVSRKRIKDFQVENSAAARTLTDKRNSPIELTIFQPKGYKDTWMRVKSEKKRLKEHSMQEKLSKRFEDELQGLAIGLTKKGTTKKTEKIWERVGRIKQSHKMVSGKYVIEVGSEKGIATTLTWIKNTAQQQEETDHGVYFIRTNYENLEQEQLWNIYNTIREVEATFRCLKSDLQIRPVHHQKDERIESHIYLTILAYQLVNTVRFMLKQKGINHDWRNIVRIMSSQTIQSIILPTETKTVKITKPSRPIKEALDIYKATNTQSMIPSKKKYVVYH